MTTPPCPDCASIRIRTAEGIHCPWCHTNEPEPTRRALADTYEPRRHP